MTKRDDFAHLKPKDDDGFGCMVESIAFLAVLAGAALWLLWRSL